MPRQMEGWKDRQKGGQTLFHRTLPATARAPKSSEGTGFCFDLINFTSVLNWGLIKLAISVTK